MNTNHPNDQAGHAAPGGGDLEQEVVQLIGRTDSDGTSYAIATLTPASDTRRKEILLDPRPIIPVIFLPGVMGSLLANRDTGEAVFFAPNTDGLLQYAGALWSLLGWWFMSASAREHAFDPDKAVVTPLGPITVVGHGVGGLDEPMLDEAEARRRGWGSVHRTSYQPVLSWLEEQLNLPMWLGKPCGAWVETDPEGRTWTLEPVIGTDPADYGGIGKGRAITLESDEFQHFMKYRYRVYAIGYNWLQSNADSARQVLDGLDYYDPKTKTTTRLMGIREICAENDTGKAIVVTHSMGGLVARFALTLPVDGDAERTGESLMHGVFHNAQPATGAPVAAKRFRTGGANEGGLNGFINGSLLGRDADGFVAVAANAPGPLELLPMPDYLDGKPWWVFARINGEVVMELPKRGDAYKEIYTSPDWYGLVPDDSLLDPAGVVKKRLDKEGYGGTVRENFIETMKSVTQRHFYLVNKYHDNTYVSYGNGSLRSRFSFEDGSIGKAAVEKGKESSDLLAWGKVIWTGNLPRDVTEEELRKAIFMHDSHKGDLRVYLASRKLTVEFEVQKVSKFGSTPGRDNGIVPGDGTVPVWSANAQARGLKSDGRGGDARGVQMAFVQGGYDHQGSCNHPWARWAVLYGIVQIVRDAPEPS